MMTEQQYLFDENIEIFCKLHKFEYPNIIKIMLAKNEDLASKIAQASFNQIITDDVFTSEETEAISASYITHSQDLLEKIKRLSVSNNIDEQDLVAKIMSSEDLIKKLSDCEINLKGVKNPESKNNIQTTMEIFHKRPSDIYYFLGEKI